MEDFNNVNYGIPVGGQALPNGVMMTSPHRSATAMQHPSGRLLCCEWSSVGRKRPKIRVLRGVVQFLRAFVSSFRSVVQTVRLSRSAGRIRLRPAAIFSIIAAAALLCGYYFASDAALRAISALNAAYMARSFIYGAVDLVLFAAALFAITRLPSVHRLLMFHGAEHKTINAYEKRLPLTVDNVRGESRFHNRCGTSLVVSVAIVCVIVPPFIPENAGDIIYTAVMLAALLIAIGVSYECMCSTHDNIVTRLGRAAQHITTAEPDDDVMIECAVTALAKAVGCHDADCG